LRVHLSLYEDETSDLCDWHINEAHFLESWSDARGYDGTTGIVQPLIAPLYGGKTAHAIIGVLAGSAGRSDYEIVRQHWSLQQKTEAFETSWRRSLHDGLIAATAFEQTQLGKLGPWAQESPPTEGLDLVFRPDPTIWDGRFANNGWLQELPKPITQLTWDNTAQVSPATAAALGVENEDVVLLELDGRKVRAPIWIVPGQADHTVVVHLGYGRTKGGRLAEGAGFNAYLLRTTKALWSASGLKVTKTGDKQKLSCTQEHDRMEGRDLIRVATIDRFRENPKLVDDHGGGHGAETAAAHADTSLYPPHPKGENSWGMVIDLNACTGCSACVIACQSENNISVVGKDQVARGREMHWIRIDRYYAGDEDSPEVAFQPIGCQHCEEAPCENVCPVNATAHSPEGLNDIAYNRCIGTRYCMNNCPYKVRRFNFLNFNLDVPETRKMQFNPNVSVRFRGVIEKCSYCVQRIQGARIGAQREGREMADGDVVTACQQACPSQAITFGDINDKASKVSTARAVDRNYALLADVGTRPRTRFLGKIRNPNPEMKG
jgi:molybdopterin-containing oxidoreductase family iron-sulfur binding subunit